VLGCASRVRRPLSNPLDRRFAVTALLAMAGMEAGVPVAEVEDPITAARLRMVARQVAARGVRDARVLEVMRRVERHRFVPEAVRDHAYEDRPLAIGYGQTISQPYIVAVMTEAARVRPGARVLEIGTGSGYQAAVLAELAGEVDSIELVEPLAKEAAARLQALGYRNVTVRAGDGYRGWPERAPFDAILVTAAPPEIPGPLLDQLAMDGRLVAPVGEGDQELVVVKRTPAGLSRRTLLPVRFVPMTGEAQQRR
jgi:protein-L-isoaspartate(D-aspartate) O-methyltransferase